MLSCPMSDAVDEIQPFEGRTEPTDDRGRPSQWRHRHVSGITTVRIRARNTGCQSRWRYVVVVRCGSVGLVFAHVDRWLLLGRTPRQRVMSLHNGKFLAEQRSR